MFTRKILSAQNQNYLFIIIILLKKTRRCNRFFQQRIKAQAAAGFGTAAFNMEVQGRILRLLQAQNPSYTIAASFALGKIYPPL